MTQTDNFFLENKPLFSGKIREIYNYGEEKLLIKTFLSLIKKDFS